MNTSRSVGRGVQHPQRVVHQCADVIAAVRRERRRHITPHERRHHPPTRVDKQWRHLAPAIRGVGKPMQAQRNWSISRPPRQRPQLPGGGFDVDPAWLAPDGHAVAPRPGRTWRSASGRRPCPASPARWTRCRWARPVPTTTVWLTNTRTTAWFGSADTDAAAGTVATAEICFSLAPGMTTSLVSACRSPGTHRSADRGRRRVAARRCRACRTAARSCSPWRPAPTRCGRCRVADRIVLPLQEARGRRQ